MRLFHVLSLLTFALFLFSCKKDNTTNSSNQHYPPNCLGCGIPPDTITLNYIYHFSYCSGKPYALKYIVFQSAEEDVNYFFHDSLKTDSTGSVHMQFHHHKYSTGWEWTVKIPEFNYNVFWSMNYPYQNNIFNAGNNFYINVGHQPKLLLHLVANSPHQNDLFTYRLGYGSAISVNSPFPAYSTFDTIYYNDFLVPRNDSGKYILYYGLGNMPDTGQVTFYHSACDPVKNLTITIP